jgi:hypothetical protein
MNPPPNNSAADAKTQSDANPEPDMMMLNRDLVVRLATEHRLRITIRPDGQIIGFRDDLTKLRSLIEAAYSTDKTEVGS